MSIDQITRGELLATLKRIKNSRKSLDSLRASLAATVWTARKQYTVEFTDGTTALDFGGRSAEYRAMWKRLMLTAGFAVTDEMTVAEAGEVKRRSNEVSEAVRRDLRRIADAELDRETLLRHGFYYTSALDSSQTLLPTDRKPKAAKPGIPVATVLSNLNSTIIAVTKRDSELKGQDPLARQGQIERLTALVNILVKVLKPTGSEIKQASVLLTAEAEAEAAALAAKPARKTKAVAKDNGAEVPTS